MDKDVIAFVGDVHGDADALRRILDRLGPSVQVYHVGDVVDRGPDSRGVLDLCVKRGVKGILGNHELWLRSLIVHHQFETMALSSVMGGEATFLSYGIARSKLPGSMAAQLLNKIDPDHQQYIKSLPPYLRVSCGPHDYLIIHSGLSVRDEPDAALALQVGGGLDEYWNDFFWRPPKMTQASDVACIPGVTQVMGHVPLRNPIIRLGHYAAIDTGCSTRLPNLLTALVVRADGTYEVVQEPGSTSVKDWSSHDDQDGNTAPTTP